MWVCLRDASVSVARIVMSESMFTSKFIAFAHCDCVCVRLCAGLSALSWKTTMTTEKASFIYHQAPLSHNNHQLY